MGTLTVNSRTASGRFTTLNVDLGSILMLPQSMFYNWSREHLVGGLVCSQVTHALQGGCNVLDDRHPFAIFCHPGSAWVSLGQPNVSSMSAWVILCHLRRCRTPLYTPAKLSHSPNKHRKQKNVFFRKNVFRKSVIL